jgi:hypothetical protein
MSPYACQINLKSQILQLLPSRPSLPLGPFPFREIPRQIAQWILIFCGKIKQTVFR